MTTRTARILIVEDDTTVEPLWHHILDKIAPGSTIKWVASEEAAEKILRALPSGQEYDLVIADIFLAGSRTGIDLWKQFGDGQSVFLLMSVIAPEKFIRLLGDAGPRPFYLQKPLNVSECEVAVHAMLAFRDLIA